jgi:hypothetical protein
LKSSGGNTERYAKEREEMLGEIRNLEDENHHLKMINENLNKAMADE